MAAPRFLSLTGDVANRISAAASPESASFALFCLAALADPFRSAGAARFRPAIGCVADVARWAVLEGMGFV